MHFLNHLNLYIHIHHLIYNQYDKQIYYLLSHKWMCALDVLYKNLYQDYDYDFIVTSTNRHEGRVTLICPIHGE